VNLVPGGAPSQRVLCDIDEDPADGQDECRRPVATFDHVKRRQLLCWLVLVTSGYGVKNLEIKVVGKRKLSYRDIGTWIS
jgi:hypothetical protein